MVKWSRSAFDGHRNHCLELAAGAPTQEIRDRLIRVARLFEIEAHLRQRTSYQILESKALITEVDVLLRAHTVRIGTAPEPRLPAPFFLYSRAGSK